jgi:hypothetical protein
MRPESLVRHGVEPSQELGAMTDVPLVSNTIPISLRAHGGRGRQRAAIRIARGALRPRMLAEVSDAFVIAKPIYHAGGILPASEVWTPGV